MLLLAGLGGMTQRTLQSRAAWPREHRTEAAAAAAQTVVPRLVLHAYGCLSRKACFARMTDLTRTSLRQPPREMSSTAVSHCCSWPMYVLTS